MTYRKTQQPTSYIMKKCFREYLKIYWTCKHYFFNVFYDKIYNKNQPENLSFILVIFLRDRIIMLKIKTFCNNVKLIVFLHWLLLDTINKSSNFKEYKNIVFLIDEDKLWYLNWAWFGLVWFGLFDAEI